MRHPLLAIKSFVLIALMGPRPIALVLSVGSIGHGLLTTPVHEQQMISYIGGLASSALLLFLMTYLFGGIPTLFAALIVGLRVLLKGQLAKMEVLLLAFGSGFLGWFLLYYLSQTPNSSGVIFIKMLRISAYFGFLGGVSALFLLPLLRRAGVLRKAL